ncbi:MAG: ABC transporter permease subunit, partial [Dehalococcoidales bacterium]|nr:ABC transporter permease subunit [Dehalococcoidales bacterium]
MKTILTIAKREITRLKSRFSGKSRAIVLGVLALAIAGSFVMYHQDLVISKGLYTIGVSANSPIIEDSRFIVKEMDRDTGYRLLDNEVIDLFLDGDIIFSNYTERADYAAAALGKYLEKQDLLRIAGEYEIDKAFPLRIEVSYAGTEPESLITSAAAAAIPDEIELETVPEGAPVYIPVTGPEPAPAGEAPDESPGAPPEVIAAVTGETTAGPQSEPQPAIVAPDIPLRVENPTDDAVRQQLAAFAESSTLPEFKAEFMSENDIIIPSLMTPPIPMAQVIITFLYVVPVFFISLFFTSSFTEEKVSRKLIVLLSAPVTRLQVIIGKMLPYLVYSIFVI